MCFAVILSGCDNGGGESVSAPSPIISSKPVSSSQSVSSPAESTENGISSESPESGISSEPPVISEPIEQTNVFNLIRDLRNEVNIRFDGNKATVYGKDSDLNIQWISIDYGDDDEPEKNGNNFTCTLSVSLRKDGFVNLWLITESGYTYSYRMKYNAAEKSLSFVVPMGSIQQNNKVTENSPILAPALVKRYVTTKENGDVNAILGKIRSLSDEICKGLDSDYDKLRAISRWVSDNIYYDYPAHDAGIPEECLSLEYMLDKHSSVCGGYANMTSALCAAQGIKCYNIKGHALQGDETYDEAHGSAAYHEWNYAVIDGRVIWIDSGWNSYNYFRSNGTYDYNGIGFKYFDIGIEAFSQNHMCDSAEYRDFYRLLE
ncbi:MAG: transglutaminase domain-containing protein [Ruminococcaceae bacterium]|nr:transglutaminase domain-containing protein [Oscillospiraceae bacterium]